MKEPCFRTITIIAAITLLLAVASAFAGNLDNAGSPAAGSGMPTLQGIYQQLLDGTPATSSGPFQEPSGGPDAGTGHTLAEIAAKLPAPDTNGAAAGDVLSGKTFWGLRTDGTWGLKTGAGDANLISGNIKNGVSIFGVTGTVIQATGSATVDNVLSGATFSNGTAAGLTGSMANQGQASFTPGPTAVPVPAGYYSGGQVNTDANLVSGNIMSGKTIFGVSGTLPPGALPHAGVKKTGQTSCWDYNGDLISCAGTGQDGDYQYGIRPVIEPTGGTMGAYNTPALVSGTRFFDNGDGTVIDNITGLIWLKNAKCYDAINWPTALTIFNNLASGNCGLSDGSTAGQWRLPNINELHSLGPNWPPGAPFTNVQLDYQYWSSSTIADSPRNAWYLDMSNGNVWGHRKAYIRYVWAVRGGQ